MQMYGACDRPVTELLRELLGYRSYREGGCVRVLQGFTFAATATFQDPAQRDAGVHPRLLRHFNVVGMHALVSHFVVMCR